MSRLLLVTIIVIFVTVIILYEQSVAIASPDGVALQPRQIPVDSRVDSGIVFEGATFAPRDDSCFLRTAIR